jgi:predicted transcriptional regulator
MIQDLHKKDWSISDIAEECQISWPTAKKYTEQLLKKQRVQVWKVVGTF